MPIHEAAEMGYPDIIKVLLEDERINVNAVDVLTFILLSNLHFQILILFFRSIIYGIQSISFYRTALHWAADKGNQEIVKLLLAHKDIKVDIRDAITSYTLSFEVYSH